MFIRVNPKIDLDKLPHGKRTNREQRKARMLYVIHLLHVKSHMHKTRGGWVALSSRIMSEMFGSPVTWMTCKRALIEARYIECKDSYQVGKKCQSYRIALPYRNQPFENLKIDFDKPVSKETLDHISLDKDLARQYLPEAIKRHTAKMAENGKQPNPQYVGYLEWCIDNFDKSFIVCPTGRLYTMGNYLPKPLRKAILINNSPTCELDVKNCHPTCLANLYKPNDKERVAYLSLVESGGFYEAIAHDIGVDRKTAKEAVLHWINGSRRFDAMDAWFRDNFPKLYAIIKQYHKKDLSVLASWLQKCESEMIRLAVSVPHLSIHDGVRVKLSDAGQAAEEIRIAFEKRDLHPKITFEN